MTTRPSFNTRTAFYGLLTLLLSISLIGCGGEDETQLSVAGPTQIGANKVVFTVGNELFESQEGDQGFSVRNTTSERLIVGAEDGASRLWLSIDYNNTVGLYTLNILNESDGLATYFTQDGIEECNYMRSGLLPDVQYEIEVEITRSDATERIVSGTFSGWFFNLDCGRVDLENGWFDISY